MSDTLTNLTYQTVQQGKNSFSLVSKTLTSQLTKLVHPTLLPMSQDIPQELILKLENRLNQLLETDWQDGQTGIYPHS
jgi:hypothetical protein